MTEKRKKSLEEKSIVCNYCGSFGAKPRPGEEEVYCLPCYISGLRRKE